VFSSYDTKLRGQPIYCTGAACAEIAGGDLTKETARSARWSDRDPLRAQVPHPSLVQGRRPGAPEDQLAIHDRGCPPSFPIPPRH